MDPGAVSLCETCRDHQSRLQELSGLLLFLGALLQVGAWWAWRGPGVTERAPLLLFSVLLLAGWAPLLLQRWAAPLVPLGPGHACRGRPAVLGRDRVGLTLEVSGGVLASWLARENAALPTPTRARDPDRDPVLSPFRGAGARVALPLGITALLGACELLGFFS